MCGRSGGAFEGQDLKTRWESEGFLGNGEFISCLCCGLHTRGVKHHGKYESYENRSSDRHLMPRGRRREGYAERLIEIDGVSLSGPDILVYVECGGGGGGPQSMWVPILDRILDFGLLGAAEAQVDLRLRIVGW